MENQEKKTGAKKKIAKKYYNSELSFSRGAMPPDRAEPSNGLPRC
jgi:hypothetical protein